MPKVVCSLMAAFNPITTFCIGLSHSLCSEQPGKQTAKQQTVLELLRAVFPRPAQPGLGVAQAGSPVTPCQVMMLLPVEGNQSETMEKNIFVEKHHL